jgi:hypothetical protein
MTFSKQWRRYNQGCAVSDTHAADTSAVFANRSEEDDIYPLTTVEIAEAQRADASIKHLFKRNAVFDQGLEVKLIENTLCVAKTVGWLYPSHSRVEQSCGTTTIYNTLDIRVSRRQ